MSTNVFEQLGYGREEAANLRARTRLMAAIRSYIQDRGLNQTEAAEIVGCSQPRISDLMNGKIDKFTVDFLINALAALGVSVDLVLGQAAEGTLEAA